ncbi:MAG TPA: GntR family transcriptional regulator [Rhodocyclaceae bacterium]|jgi:GntR family transcriptional regulator|nr:GntR family transcriptional regulator [Rhodocyclaceae bacterium]
MSELSPDASRGLQPLYAQIAEALRGRILDGSYQPHDRIPSESEMMLAFNVSRITVRQALKELENEGLIFKLQGKGSFVSRPRPFQELTRLQGFGQAMSQLGYETVNQVLGVATVAASPLVAERLALPPGSPVTEIRRVRHVDREPISLDVTYLPQELGERLAREDLVGRDIFVIIENDYGLPLGHADLSIEATVADADVAAALGIARASPILRIERLVHGQDGRPLDFEFLYHRGDAFRYRLRVER